jgi:hypothetical protein
MAEENIVIKIKADVGITKEVIDAVTKAMESLGKTATIVSGNVKVTNKNLEDTSKILGQVTQTANGANNALGNTSNTLKKSNQQWMNLALVVQDLPYGFRGIQNNLPALLGGIAGVGGAAYLAFSVIISGLTFWDEHNRKVAASAKKLKEQEDEVLKGVSSEAVKVNELIAVLENETETRDRKRRAIKELQSINPDVFKDLKLEGDKVENLNTYYNKYIENLKNVILLKKYEKDLENIIQAELKTGTPLQLAKQKELKNSADLLTLNNQAIKDNITTTKILTLKDEKVIGNINKYNNSQQQKLDLLEKIRKISPAVALGGGKDGAAAKEPKQKVSKYEEELARSQFNFYKDNLFQAETYFNQLNDIQRLNALKEAVINKASNEELTKIEETYAQNSINFHKQIEDKKFAIREASLKRGEQLTEADQKAKKKILDTEFQNEMDVIQNRLSAQLKGHRKEPLKQGEDYKQAVAGYLIMSMEAGRTAEEIEKLQDKINNLNSAAEGTAAAFKPMADILNNLATNTLVEFGTQVGDLLSGGKFSLDGFLGMIANALIQIGTHLVLISKLFLAVDALFASGGALAPFAIPIGIAAIVAGVALKNSLSKKGDVKKFADGGIISGPTMGLMGEYPGAKSNPEVVAPLDKLKDMMGGGGGSFVLRGSDLVLALNRSQTSLNLRRGS